MSGEGFPQTGRQEIAGQVSFQDVEKQAIERIKNINELEGLDDLMGMKEFSENEGLKEAIEQRRKAIEKREQIIFGINSDSDEKMREKVTNAIESSEFTLADKKKIARRVKDRLDFVREQRERELKRQGGLSEVKEAVSSGDGSNMSVDLVENSGSLNSADESDALTKINPGSESGEEIADGENGEIDDESDKWNKITDDIVGAVMGDDNGVSGEDEQAGDSEPEGADGKSPDVQEILNEIHQDAEKIGEETLNEGKRIKDDIDQIAGNAIDQIEENFGNLNSLSNEDENDENGTDQQKTGYRVVPRPVSGKRSVKVRVKLNNKANVDGENQATGGDTDQQGVEDDVDDTDAQEDGSASKTEEIIDYTSRNPSRYFIGNREVTYDELVGRKPKSAINETGQVDNGNNKGNETDSGEAGKVEAKSENEVEKNDAKAETEVKKNEKIPNTDEFIQNLEKFVKIDERTTFEDVRKKAEEIYRSDDAVWDEKNWDAFMSAVEERFNKIQAENEKNVYNPRRNGAIDAWREWKKNKAEGGEQDAAKTAETDGSQDTETGGVKNEAPEEKEDSEKKRNENGIDDLTAWAKRKNKLQIASPEETLKKSSDPSEFARNVELDEEKGVDFYIEKMRGAFPKSETMDGAKKILKNRFALEFGEDYIPSKIEYIPNKAEPNMTQEKYLNDKTMRGWTRRFRDGVMDGRSIIRVIDELEVKDLEGVSLETIRESLERYYYLSHGGTIKLYSYTERDKDGNVIEKTIEARDKSYSQLKGYDDEMRTRIQEYAISRYKQLGLDHNGNKLDEPEKVSLRKKIARKIKGLEIIYRGE